jgi:hypothetical protein
MNRPGAPTETSVSCLNLLSGGAAASPIVVPSDVLSRWGGPAVIDSGVVIPRDALDGTPYNRVDLRLTKSIRLTPTTLSSTSSAVNATFGQPNAADIPREGQLAFRMTF